MLYFKGHFHPVWPLLCLLVVFITGCVQGPNTASVSGVITLDGEPTAGIDVQFSLISGGRPSVGVTDQSGYYYLRFTQAENGCIPGQHIVNLRAYREPGVEATQFLPKQYNTRAEENPDMLIDVKNGKQTINFDITTNK